MANTPITGSWLNGWDLALQRTCFDKVAIPLGLTDYAKDTTFYPDDIAQREIAQKRGDNSLEFMNLWRGVPNLNSAHLNAALGRGAAGFGIQGDLDPTKSARVNAVHITAPYTVRVWSKSLERINAVAEAWLLWRYKSPAFDIYAKILDTVIPLRGNMHIGALSDASQVAQMFADGRYYSISLAIELQATVFRIISYPYADHIIVKLYYSIDPTTKQPTQLLQEWSIPTN